MRGQHEACCVLAGGAAEELLVLKTQGRERRSVSWRGCARVIGRAGSVWRILVTIYPPTNYFMFLDMISKSFKSDSREGKRKGFLNLLTIT